MGDQPAAGLQSLEKRRRFRWLLGSGFLVLCGILLSLGYISRHVEVFLRDRTVETLEAKLHSHVTLQRLGVRLWRGLEVTGFGLRVEGQDATSGQAPYALLTVGRFSFRSSFWAVWQRSTLATAVEADQVQVHVPPPEERGAWRHFRKEEEFGNTGAFSRFTAIFPELRCRNVHLVFERNSPSEGPLQLDLAELNLEGSREEGAVRYDAVLRNAKPYGAIHAIGHLGSWTEAPRAEGSRPDAAMTPVDGEYTFDHADLSTIHGLRGTLSSHGRFAGVLHRIVIEGQTDTPDFALDRSSAQVPLRTEFHALVDGTNGNISLEAAHVHLGKSDFLTSGRFVNVQGQGRDIELTGDVAQGRVQDFLRLAVRTSPPVMNGIVTMQTRVHIPPGHGPIPMRLEMAGTLRVAEVRFSNAAWQSRLEEWSARAQGRSWEVAGARKDRQAMGYSQLAATFSMRRGVFVANDVRYVLPGVAALLNGVYSMDGKLFEFKGHVRTKAMVSQLVGGWKGWLLKPVDGLLQKHGAGIEVPVEISGTQGELHLGSATQGTADSAEAMLADAKGKVENEHLQEAARRLIGRAASEDEEAAAALSLQGAQRAHSAAVQDRSEALRILGGMKH